MQTRIKYLAIIIFATCFHACSNEMLLEKQHDRQISINAIISPTLVTRVSEDGTSFSDNDIIKVQNLNSSSQNIAVYKYSASSNEWNTSDEMYWEGYTNNEFIAWYPAATSYSEFTILLDQSEGISEADWMTAHSVVKQSAGTVNLAFYHHLTKISVDVVKWGNEFQENERILTEAMILSPSTVITKDDSSIDGDRHATWVNSLIKDETLTAIIAPGVYSAGTQIMQIYVNNSLTPLIVKASSTITLESGKSYKYRLTIGKDVSFLDEVNVTINDWEEELLNDQIITSTAPLTIHYIDEYSINHGSGTQIDGVVWAPVNCGYHKTDYPYGKLYQWGRKYGQGYSGDATFPSAEEIITAPVSLNIGQSAEYANVYFSGKGDWCNEQINDLWANSSGNQTEYDPCPKGWRVPTYEELNSLSQNYSSHSTLNGQNGYFFSGSYERSNGAPEVFFPSLGFRDTNGTSYVRDSYGHYWSSTPCETGAYFLYTDGDKTKINTSSNRTSGFGIRCVSIYGAPHIESINIKHSELTLPPNFCYTFEPLIYPSEVIYPTLNWASSDASVATINQDGKLTTISDGITTITVMAEGGANASCTVTVKASNAVASTDYIDEFNVNHGKGIVIGNTVWAPVNCGFKATSDTDLGFPYGKLYQWGRKHGQGYSDEYDAETPLMTEGYISISTGLAAENANIFYTGSDWADPKYGELTWNSGTETNPVKNTSNDPCPTGWRIPTKQEITTLLKNHSDWVSDGIYPMGIYFSGEYSTICGAPKIFLPAAGSRGGSNGAHSNRDVVGSYWSSGSHFYYVNSMYYTLRFFSTQIKIHESEQTTGNTIRCVQE